MSRFSQAEAEAAGWTIVHQRDEYAVTTGPGVVKTTPQTIVAEKYLTAPGLAGRLVHEEAESMGKLLERIYSFERHLGNVPEFSDTTEPFPVDDFAGALDADGDPIKTVVIPAEPSDLTFESENFSMTDAEWSARQRADTLVVKGDDGETHQVQYAGGGEDVLDAEDLRLQSKKAIEDRRAAEPAVGPAKQVEFETAGQVDTPGIGAGGTLVVRADEEPGDVAQRKEDLKKMKEEGRVGHQINTGFDAVAPEGADKLAGLDVSIQERSDLSSDSPGQGRVERVLVEPENEIEEAPPAPHVYPEGVEPEPEPLPDQDSTEAAVADAQEELEDEALEARDEDPDAGSIAALEGVTEDGQAYGQEEAPVSPEATADPVSEPSETDTSEDTPDPFTEKDDVEATDAAKAKAAELGFDLSQVKGTGKAGRITAPDVDAAVEAAYEPKGE